MFGFIAYDLVMPATQTDEAVVTGISKHFVNSRYTYSVQGQGRYRYNEEVNRSMYERLEEGDTLRVSLSRFFSEWKSLEVIRDGKIIARTRGDDLYFMGLFGILFLLSVAAFLPDRLLFRNLIVIITLPVVNLVGVMLWIRFIQLWTGQIDKM
jgi:hypothetical protein